MAHIGQSRPDYGLDLSYFQGKVLNTFEIVLSSLGGWARLGID